MRWMYLINDNEVVITKFFRALLEEWDNKITTIRESRGLDEIPLEAVYCRLNAYDLEKQQRKTRKDGKIKLLHL